jgi:hypothetical protein
LTWNATLTWNAALTWNVACSYMQHGHGMQCGHGHAALTWTCSMDMDTEHGFGYAALNRTVDMYGSWIPACQ